MSVGVVSKLRVGTFDHRQVIRVGRAGAGRFDFLMFQDFSSRQVAGLYNVFGVDGTQPGN